MHYVEGLSYSAIKEMANNGMKGTKIFGNYEQQVQKIEESSSDSDEEEDD